jgi:hypothetical protein
LSTSPTGVAWGTKLSKSIWARLLKASQPQLYAEQEPKMNYAHVTEDGNKSGILYDWPELG